MHALILCPFAKIILKNNRLWSFIRGTHMESFLDCCCMLRASSPSRHDFEVFITCARGVLNLQNDYVHGHFKVIRRDDTT